MDLTDPYYERVLYKKGAVENLSSLLLDNFKNKKVFFLSGKTSYQKFGTFVINEINYSNFEFVFKIVDSNTKKTELTEIAKDAKECAVIIALGGGSVCDGAKYISLLLNLPYILLPTIPSTCAYFTPFAFVQNNFYCEKINCDFPYKILIDENFILKCKNEHIISGVKFVLSFWEVALNIEINNLLFDKKQSISSLRLLLSKLKDNQDYILSCDDNAKLILMDILIDLGFVLKGMDISIQNAFMLANLLKSCEAIVTGSFGTLCLTATKMLFEAYRKFFALKKIDIYSFLDVESLANNLTRMQLNVNVINLKNIKTIRQNKQLFLKINAVKNQVSSLIEKYYEEIVFKTKEKQLAKINMPKCLMSFHVLPYVYNCSCLTNILSSSGLIN